MIEDKRVGLVVVVRVVCACLCVCEGKAEAARYDPRLWRLFDRLFDSTSAASNRRGDLEMAGKTGALAVAVAVVVVVTKSLREYIYIYSRRTKLVRFLGTRHSNLQ